MKNAPLLNGVKFYELRIASVEARILYLLGSENTVWLFQTWSCIEESLPKWC